MSGGGGHKVRMRVIEYHVQVDGQDVPEMFCLITDLLDCRAYPAAMLVAAYKWRCDGSETALREVKSAIPGAGPSTGPIFRSATPDLIRAEHAVWITVRELVRATARTAARAARPAVRDAAPGSPSVPARSPSPPPAAPPVTTTRDCTAAASLPPRIRGDARQSALRELSRRRVSIDRGRHRDHKTKGRQAFPAAGRSITTRTALASIAICGPLAD
jgi:hypothetical protein